MQLQHDYNASILQVHDYMSTTIYELTTYLLITSVNPGA
jgi:hypothetical protein